MRHGAVRGISRSILAPAFHLLRTTDVGLSPRRGAMG